MFPFLAQFYPGNIIPGPGKSAQATWEAVKDKVRAYVHVYVLCSWRVGESGCLCVGVVLTDGV